MTGRPGGHFSGKLYELHTVILLKTKRESRGSVIMKRSTLPCSSSFPALWKTASLGGVLHVYNI